MYPTIGMSIEYYYVPELPADVMVEILSRLPIKALAVCQLVCKEWLFIISDRRFLKIHISRSPAGILLIPIDDNPITKPLRLIDADTLRIRCPRETQMKLNSKIDFPLPGNRYRFMNSVHGLLCFTDGNRTHICNPILGEQFVLPSEPPIHFLQYKISALGFSPRTNQYKVIEFVNSGDKYNVLARFYTFGESSWKNIGHVPCYMDFPRTIDAVLDGVIHWLAPSRTSSCFIGCFGFDSDQLGLLPGPPDAELVENYKELEGRACLGVLGDSLAMFVHYNMSQFAIWIMNDYGVMGSWSKLYAIGSMDKRLWGCYEPVVILKNGEVLMSLNRTCLVIYNPKLNVLRDICVHGDGSRYLSIAFVPSLVSLNDVAKGENIKKKAEQRKWGKRKSEYTLF